MNKISCKFNRQANHVGMFYLPSDIEEDYWQLAWPLSLLTLNNIFEDCLFEIESYSRLSVIFLSSFSSFISFALHHHPTYCNNANNVFLSLSVSLYILANWEGEKSDVIQVQKDRSIWDIRKWMKLLMKNDSEYLIF